MLRIGICDDIYDARLVLRAALERVLEKRRVQGQFREFSSGEGLLRWLESHAGELDLVFLDMEMGELDGMETARRIRERDGGVLIVFITNMADFPLVNAEYSKVFAENPPARSCVAVKELPLGGLVEIEVLAVV